MNASSSAAGSPALDADVRSAAGLWPILLDIARARRPDDVPTLPVDTLTWTTGIGWQLQGRWDAQALELFDLFKPLLGSRPEGGAWVIAQLGQSLDGCVATRTGDSSFINGPENLLHLHRLRALCDAVIVGRHGRGRQSPLDDSPCGRTPSHPRAARSTAETCRTPRGRACLQRRAGTHAVVV
jgi:hypothetical protein